jgi:hypothetical protein
LKYPSRDKVYFKRILHHKLSRPVVKVLNSEDLRRARAAGHNGIPISAGEIALQRMSKGCTSK